jgi:hypothetical protein
VRPRNRRPSSEFVLAFCRFLIVRTQNNQFHNAISINLLQITVVSTQLKTHHRPNAPIIAYFTLKLAAFISNVGHDWHIVADRILTLVERACSATVIHGVNTRSFIRTMLQESVFIIAFGKNVYLRRPIVPCFSSGAIPIPAQQQKSYSGSSLKTLVFPNNRFEDVCFGEGIALNMVIYLHSWRIPPSHCNCLYTVRPFSSRPNKRLALSYETMNDAFG